MERQKSRDSKVGRLRPVDFDVITFFAWGTIFILMVVIGVRWRADGGIGVSGIESSVRQSISLSVCHANDTVRLPDEDQCSEKLTPAAQIVIEQGPFDLGVRPRSG